MAVVLYTSDGNFGAVRSFLPLREKGEEGSNVQIQEEEKDEEIPQSFEALNFRGF